MKPLTLAATAFLSLLAAGRAQALDNVQYSKTPPSAPSQADYEEKLLGDLGGLRGRLAEAGVEIGLDYAGDVWGVASGALKRRVTYLDFIELRANLDGEKLFGIKGNSLSVSLTDSNGTSSNASTVGSTQGIDNNEVGARGVRLYEAWMEQNFFEDRLSLLVGLHDVNSEFAVTSLSDHFLTPTFQLGQSFAQSGENGPSAFPTTSLAARVKVKPTDDSYAAFAVYDGVPGAPNGTSGTAIRLDRKDGLLLVGELAYVPPAADSEDAPNKLAVGGWNYTAGLDDLTRLDGNGNPARSTAQGLYFLSSARLYHDAPRARSLGVFLRLGAADGDTAQVDWDYVAGVVGNGWLPGRPDGEVGLGVSGAHNGDKYRRSVAAGGDASARNETSFELYYRDTLGRGITLQPAMQYVVNPGTDTVTDDALIFGTRLGISF